MTALLLPVAGQSSRYPGTMPKWLLTMPSSKLMLEESVEAIDLSKFERVIVIALQEHISEYSKEKELLDRLKSTLSEKIELCVLASPTTCQAQTILEAIIQKSISGPIVIKDCDNKFSIDMTDGINVVGYVNMHSIQMAEASSKSYINIDDIGRIDNIVEKQIISNYFCCGAYGFASAEQFLEATRQLLEYSEDVYISHVILHLLLANEVFYAREAHDYTDWGTLKEFQDWQRKYLSIICNLDGCLLEKDAKISGKKKMHFLEENLRSLKKLSNDPFMNIILLTSRPESERGDIMRVCYEQELKIHSLIMGLPQSRQILINDFSSSKLYPSSISANLITNSTELEPIINSLLR